MDSKGYFILLIQALNKNELINLNRAKLSRVELGLVQLSSVCFQAASASGRPRFGWAKPEGSRSRLDFITSLTISCGSSNQGGASHNQNNGNGKGKNNGGHHNMNTKGHNNKGSNRNNNNNNYRQNDLSPRSMLTCIVYGSSKVSFVMYFYFG